MEAVLVLSAALLDFCPARVLQRYRWLWPASETVFYIGLYMILDRVWVFRQHALTSVLLCSSETQTWYCPSANEGLLSTQSEDTNEHTACIKHLCIAVAARASVLLLLCNA